MLTNVDAVTVFNGRLDKESRRTKYIPTVIRGVSYVEAKGATISSSGVWGDNINFKIRIPLSAEIPSGRSFLPDLEYAPLDDAEAVKYWTVQKTDLILEGEHAGDGSALFEDALMAYAKEKGLTVIHVAEYADNTKGGSLYMRHWRIGGK